MAALAIAGCRSASLDVNDTATDFWLSVWVLEQVLGEHVAPPPPDVPALERQEPKMVENLTLRERTELPVLLKGVLADQGVLTAELDPAAQP